MITLDKTKKGELFATLSKLLPNEPPHPNHLERTVHFVYSQYYHGNRWYHNHSHISDILTKFHSFCQDTGFDQNIDEIKLALIFHDVIYDLPNLSKLSNEHKSALLFERIANSHQGNLDVKLVSDLIRSTEHSNPQWKSTPQSPLEYQIVHDLDFSSLGKSYPEFVKDGIAIRAEYWFVPEETFQMGREAFLTEMLNQNPIFLTEYFREKYEHQAKDNLRKSLQDEQ